MKAIPSLGNACWPSLNQYTAIGKQGGLAKAIKRVISAVVRRSDTQGPRHTVGKGERRGYVFGLGGNGPKAQEKRVISANSPRPADRWVPRQTVEERRMLRDYLPLNGGSDPKGKEQQIKEEEKRRETEEKRQAYYEKQTKNNVEKSKKKE